MGKYYDIYNIDGKEVSLPRTDYRYITKDEFKRAMALVAENTKIALSKVPELEQIIRDFDGRPAKKKFEEALNKHGFSLDGHSIYMPMTSNCVFADNGEEAIGYSMLQATRFNLEKGICLCGYIMLDEEDLIDAERTLSKDEYDDGLSYSIRMLKRELEELTDPRADEWIDKMHEARELLRDIRQTAPEELRFRLFNDFLDDAGRCE